MKEHEEKLEQKREEAKPCFCGCGCTWVKAENPANLRTEVI